MKRFALFAVIAAAMMLSCTNKGQTGGTTDGDSIPSDSTVIEAVADTTPQPMFVYYQSKSYPQMVYWDSEGDSLQNLFRRRAALYTNLMIDDETTVKIKYVDELLKNPDGEKMYGGELHSRPTIPAPGLRYDFADAKDKSRLSWGMYVVVTDSYLQSRKHIKMRHYGYDAQKPLPAKVVKQLEGQYKMKAQRSKLCASGDRYAYGTLQFKGAFQTVDEQGKPVQRALALEVVTVGDSVYSYPVEGYYDEQWGATWNADDEGEYLPSAVTFFEGPDGPEICYEHGAPESITVGMMYVRNGKLEQQRYEVYHTMIDEQTPLWKKDVSKLRQLYLAYDRNAHKDFPLTKWQNIDIDGDGVDELWLRSADNLHGAFFIRQGDDNFKLIGVETPQLRPAFTHAKDGVAYLIISGTKGGNLMWEEVLGIKKSQLVEHLTVTDIDGDITEATHNGKTIQKWEAANYLDALPDVTKHYEYFQEIEN